MWSQLEDAVTRDHVKAALKGGGNKDKDDDGYLSDGEIVCSLYNSAIILRYDFACRASVTEKAPMHKTHTHCKNDNTTWVGIR